MKVTWYKGSKCANFDDSDKELAAKMMKKGWNPKKKVEPPVVKEKTHGK